MDLKSKKIYFNIKNSVEQAQKILLVGHKDPDGDCVASVLAGFIFLKNLNKDVNMFSHDKVPEYLNFLPFINLIQTEKIKINDFDLIIYLDCADCSRAGVEDVVPQKIKTINIDHHATNNNFVDINLVQPESSSTCEILYEFFKFNKIKLNFKIATCLLTGIITDTDFFVNPNTTQNTLSIVSDLIKSGAKLKSIWKNIYQQNKIQHLKLWGLALSRLHLDKKTNMATTAIFQKDFESENFQDEAVGGLANFLNTLSEAKSILILKEKENSIIKGSLRTIHEDVDVAKIAKEYGGGGHTKAAGFEIKGKIVGDEKTGWRVGKEK